MLLNTVSNKQSRNYAKVGARTGTPCLDSTEGLPTSHTCLLENGFCGIKLFLCSNHIRTQTNNSCARRNPIQPLQKFCFEFN